MTKNEVFQSILDCLNSAFEADPNAMQSLLCNRVPCNEKLADHPTIQVAAYHGLDDGFHVGMLGVVNGVLECAGFPLVAARFDSDVPKGEPATLRGFQQYIGPENVE